MNNKLKLLGALLAISCGSANAGLILVGGTPVPGQGSVSARAGVCTVNFNAGNAANSCGATYTGSGGGHFVTGSVSGQYATPAGDTSGYFTVGPSSGGTSYTITLATAANYFGFYAGSLDTYNTVTFFLGASQVDAFTGAMINAVAFPTQPTNGNQAEAQYIDYFPTSLYDRIVYSSTADAFETDNHAFGVVSVPEPASTALLGLGVLGLLAARRRKA